MDRWDRTYKIEEDDTPERVASKVAGLMRTLARTHASKSMRVMDREGYNAARALVGNNVVVGEKVTAMLDSGGTAAISYRNRRRNLPTKAEVDS